MNYKYACVVDAQRMYKTLVLVLPEPDKDGVPRDVVQNYTLVEGEQLIDTRQPAIRTHAGMNGFIDPRWDFEAEAWAEAATADEIAAWEAEHPAPPTPPPSMQEQQFAVMALQQAEQTTQINQLQQANAMLMLQLAESQKGGTDNV